MTGADILKLDDRKYETVDVPEWNLTLRIRSLSLGERLSVEWLTSDKPSPESSLTFQGSLVQLSCCHGDGQLLFAPADVPALAEKNPMAIQRIFWAAIRLNKMRAEDIEELQRNFTKAP